MAKNIVNQIRKATRRKFSAEEKIRIVLEGLRGEIPISELASLPMEAAGWTRNVSANRPIQALCFADEVS